KKVTVDNDNTTIIEGAGAPAAIEGRVKQLRAQVEDTSSEYDREKLHSASTSSSGSSRIACRILPACAIAIAGPRRVRGDGRQPRGIPVLPASDAPPVAAGLDRALGHIRRCVAHRTHCRSEDVLFLQYGCREATGHDEGTRIAHSRLLMLTAL